MTGSRHNVRRLAGMAAFLLASILALAAGEGLDLSPYEKVFDQAGWRAPHGGTLVFAALGNSGEERGRALAVFEKADGPAERLFLDQDRGHNPWKVRVCELDGDALPEIAAGVYKKSRRDPVMDRRLFVYDLNEDGRLFPKWLGSRLGLRLVDFEFAPGADGKDALITVEHAGRDRLVLRRYEWNGFGFTQTEDIERVAGPKNYESERDRLLKMMRTVSGKGEEE